MKTDKLAFRILGCTSYDEQHPPDELLIDKHSPLVVGWQSERFSTFPQVLVFHLPHGVCRLKKIQMLVHHFKIPTRIEVHVANIKQPTRSYSWAGLGPGFIDTIPFYRLGYVALNDNSQSGYSARELKTIHMDVEANLIKLVIEKCYVNPLNLYNQVGLVALNVLGHIDSSDAFLEKMVDSGLAANEMNDISRAILKGILDKSIIDRQTLDIKDLIYALDHDRELTEVVVAIKEAKEAAVKQQQFEKANALRLLEISHGKASADIAKVSVKKHEAIQIEDYTTAAAVQHHIENIKSDLEQEMKAAGFKFFGGDVVEITTWGTINNNPHIEPYVEVSVAELQPTEESSRQPSTPGRNKIANPQSEAHSNNGGGDKENSNTRNRNSVPRDEKIVKSISVDNNDRRSPIDSPRKLSKDSDLSQKSVKSPSAQVKIDDEAESVDESKTPTNSGSRSPPIPTLRNNKSSLAKQIAAEPVDEPEASKSPRRPKTSNPAKSKKKVSKTSTEDEKVLDAKDDFSGSPPPLKSVPKDQKFQSDGVADENDEEVQLTPEQTKEYVSAIQFFGAPTVSGILSKEFKRRESALNKMQSKLVTSGEHGIDLQRAALKLLIVALDDTREKSSALSLNTFEKILDLTSADKNERIALLALLEEPFQIVLLKAAETNPRIKKASTDVIQLLLKQFNAVPASILPLLVKPILPRKGTAVHHRHIKLRLDVLNDSIIQYGLDDITKKGSVYHGLLSKDVSKFIKPYIDHVNSEVRSATLEVAATLASIVGQDTVLDDLKGLRDSQILTLKSKLAPSKDELGSESSASGTPKNVETKKSKTDANVKSASSTNDYLSRTCIFCEFYNPNFTEDTFDDHFWEECPVLLKCDKCGQVVEIALYDDHFLSECDRDDVYKRCERCLHAIPEDKYAYHLKAKKCNQVPEGMVQCPLCTKNFNDGEDMKQHYIQLPGCKFNKRKPLVSSNPKDNQSHIEQGGDVATPKKKKLFGLF